MTRVLLFFATNIAVILLLSITASLLGIGRYLDESGTGLDLSALLAFCALFGFGGAFISLLISKFIAKKSMGVKLIDPKQPANETETWLIERISELANQAKIGMPEVGIFNSPDPNAFATGANRNNALVAVSTGLLHNMNREEVTAVLAHEVAHVENGDMITLGLIQGVVNTFVMFFARIIGHFVDRVVFRNQEGHGFGFMVATVVAEIILGMLAQVIVMWFSRWREFRADAGAAKLYGAMPMISALENLKYHQQGQAPGLPDQMNAFGIRNGASKFGALFSSHPPLDARIDALKRL